MRIFKLLLRFVKSDNRASILQNWINKTPPRILVKKLLILFNFSSWKKRQNKALFSTINAYEQNAVESLQRHGYAYVTELIEPALLNRTFEKTRALQADAENISKNQIVRNKDIWVRLTDQEYISNNTTANVFNELALQNSVLRVVGSYFKSAPYLVDSIITLSTGTGKELKYSQLWHLDYNDTTMLKLFVYLTDVEDDKHGPFMFIDKVNSAKIKKPFLWSHLSDDLLFSQIATGDVIEVKKKKLNAFMVDTSKCYHAGSRLAAGEERLMLTALYVDLPCIYPSITSNSIRDNTFNLSPLQKLAITP